MLPEVKEQQQKEIRDAGAQQEYSSLILGSFRHLISPSKFLPNHGSNVCLFVFCRLFKTTGTFILHLSGDVTHLWVVDMPPNAFFLLHSLRRYSTFSADHSMPFSQKYETQNKKFNRSCYLTPGHCIIHLNWTPLQLVQVDQKSFPCSKSTDLRLCEDITKHLLCILLYYPLQGASEISVFTPRGEQRATRFWPSQTLKLLPFVYT